MQHLEYRVIPAPTRGLRAPGRKTREERFAHAIEARINEMAAEGWTYLRADILPSTERQGLTSTQTVYRTVLVFAREPVAAAAAPPPGPDLEAPAQPPQDAAPVLRAERGMPPPPPADDAELRARAEASLVSQAEGREDPDPHR